MPEKEPVLVSMCLFGVPCRYHGETKRLGRPLYRRRRIAQLQKRYHLIPVCPEQMGGLPTPREPCRLLYCEKPLAEPPDPKALLLHRVLGKVTGKDYTEEFCQGAWSVLGIATIMGVKKAYLQKGSPSCDPDHGMTSWFLKQAGIKVYRA